MRVVGSKAMRTKLENSLRVGAVGLAMLAGSLVMTPGTAAQDTPEPAATEEDDGFDDWGLLGLLGLAGLAGLKRREPEVRPVDRTDRPAR